MEVYSGPVNTNEGTLLYSIIHDVTEQVKLESMLKDKLNQLNALLDSSLSLIMIKDTEGKFVHVNNQFAESIGKKAEDLIGKSDYDLFSAELADYFRKGDLSVIETGKPIITQDTVKFDGRDRHFLGTRTPLLDDKGNVHGICVITTDITEQKDLEIALNAASQQKDLLLKNLTTELRTICR